MKYLHIIYLLLTLHFFESFGQSTEEINQLRLRELSVKLRNTSIDTAVSVKVPLRTLAMLRRQKASLDEYLNWLVLKEEILRSKKFSLDEYLKLVPNDVLSSLMESEIPKGMVPSDDVSAERHVDVSKFNSNVDRILSKKNKPPFVSDDESSDTQINIVFPLPPRKNTPEDDFTNLTLVDLDNIIKNMVTQTVYLTYSNLERKKRLDAYHKIASRIRFIIYIQNQ